MSNTSSNLCVHQWLSFDDNQPVRCQRPFGHIGPHASSPDLEGQPAPEACPWHGAVRHADCDDCQTIAPSSPEVKAECPICFNERRVTIGRRAVGQDSRVRTLQMMYIEQPCPLCLPMETSDSEPQQCQEADGCPTETAVLKRFWRLHRSCLLAEEAKAIDIYGPPLTEKPSQKAPAEPAHRIDCGVVNNPLSSPCTCGYNAQNGRTDGG